MYLIRSGAKLIKFVDRTFNIKPDYALDIFQFLIDHHDGCVFQFEITADIMREEVLEFLSKHAPPGIFRFEIGVQSTNDRTNEIIMRRQNFERLARTVTMIKDSGKIVQHLDLIAGLPEEDYESFRKTFNDVFALRPEELQLGFLKMLRGTGLRENADRYGYRYMDEPPYEVLSNNVLSFADVIRIKRVEDILEKYWNDHRMDHTVEYLIENEFDTPFDFFQQFGDYWEAQGWPRIGHQLDHLFKRLKQFLDSVSLRHREVAESLMKLDYFLGHRYKPRHVWWEHPVDKKGTWTLDEKDSECPRIAVPSICGKGMGGKRACQTCGCRSRRHRSEALYRDGRNREGADASCRMLRSRSPDGTGLLYGTACGGGGKAGNFSLKKTKRVYHLRYTRFLVVGLNGRYFVFQILSGKGASEHGPRVACERVSTEIGRQQ